MGFAGAEHDFPRTWQAAVGIVTHAWRDPGPRDRSTLGASLRLTKEDHSGYRLAHAALLWTGLYRRIEARGEIHARVGSLRLRPSFRLGWGDHLPLSFSFPLGGYDGFPGLHIGELRGDRELMLDVLMTYPLKGPLVVRTEVGAGRSSTGGSLIDGSGWVSGARVGLGAETPVGPVRFEYGL